MAGWRDLLGTTISSFKIGINKATLAASGLTAARTYTLPDVSGTVALTADVAAKVTKAGDTLTGALNSATPITVASATTCNIFAAASDEVTISGTAAITAFDTIAAGARRFITASGAFTLTHNATSLICPTGANIVCVAGDTFEVLSLGSGNARIAAFSRASGSPLAGGGGDMLLGTVQTVTAGKTFENATFLMKSSLSANTAAFQNSGFNASTVFSWPSASGTVAMLSDLAPPGVDKQILFNDNGAYTSTNNIQFRKLVNQLVLDNATGTYTGTGTSLSICASSLPMSSESSGANANHGVYYVRRPAGKNLPVFKGGGNGYPLAPHSGFVFSSQILPNSSTTISTIACTLTNVGTVSTPTQTSGSIKNASRRFSIASATTAGSLASLRVNNLEVYGGQQVGGFFIGGFFMVARFSLDTLAAGMRAFVGLTDTATTAPTNIDPLSATAPGRIGMAINSNTGNWSLVSCLTGSAPTVLALGANFPVDTTTLYELILSRPPDTSSNSPIDYRVTNLTTYAGTVDGTTGIGVSPTTLTFLGRTAWASNNATAAAVAFSMNRFCLESEQ